MAYRCLPQGLAVLAAAIAVVRPAGAGEPLQPAPPQPSLELWTGGQTFGGEWSIYTGATWAPFGSVHEDGFRLRAVLGTGAYGLTGTDAGGSVAFGDILAGYHTQYGPVTLKLLAGLTIAEHSPVGQASTSGLGGTALGPKVLLETWWSLSPRAWASLDLGLAMPFVHATDGIADWGEPKRIDCTCRLRVGWKVWQTLSLGLEGGAGGALAPTLRSFWANSGPAENGMAYAGGFLRYEWAGGEVSISAGGILDGDEPEGRAHAFGTVSLLTRF
jgi:hypothetical protein